MCWLDFLIWIDIVDGIVYGCWSFPQTCSDEINLSFVEAAVSTGINSRKEMCIRDRFLDTAKIKVKAGNGGDGMVAFRREKYVPNGGPWGGDGGRGGNVIFVVDEGLRTLMDFRYNRHFKAQNGEKGMTKGMHGRGAEDLYVRVPQGLSLIHI